MSVCLYILAGLGFITTCLIFMSANTVFQETVASNFLVGSVVLYCGGAIVAAIDRLE